MGTRNVLSWMTWMKCFVTVEWTWLDVAYPGWHRLNGLSLVKCFVGCGTSVMQCHG